MKITKTKAGLIGLLLLAESILPNPLGSAAPQKAESYETTPITQAQTYETSQSQDYNSTNSKLKRGNYPNPYYGKNDNFASDTDALLLARAIYGESRGQLEGNDTLYLHMVAETIINRKNRSGKSLKNVLLGKGEKTVKRKKIVDGEKIVQDDTIQVYYYTCFDPSDPNYRKLKNPLNNGEGDESKRKQIWEKCYDIARDVLTHNHKNAPVVRGSTNYYVGGDPTVFKTKRWAELMGIPAWAFLMHGKDFILDKQGNRIPRVPLAEINLSNGKTARSYNFGNDF